MRSLIIHLACCLLPYYLLVPSGSVSNPTSWTWDTHPPPPTSTNTLWQTGGAHPTEMLSCYGPYPEIVYLSTLIACNAMN